jgi:hypothetical protein
VRFHDPALLRTSWFTLSQGSSHSLSGCLRCIECPKVVDTSDVLCLFRLHFQGFCVRIHACIDHHHIQPSEVVEHLFRDRFNLAGLGYICFVGFGCSCGVFRMQFRGALLCERRSFLRRVNDCYGGCPSFCIALGDGKPDTSVKEVNGRILHTEVHRSEFSADIHVRSIPLLQNPRITYRFPPVIRQTLPLSENICESGIASSGAVRRLILAYVPFAHGLVWM